jgi:uncharacterized protein (TIGR02246 family)
MNTTIEKSDIEKLLFTYSDALNTSDVSKLLSLYTNDGTVMPNNAPSSIGLEQLKAAYEFMFQTVQLNVEYFIDEVIVTGDYAYARTNSRAKTLIPESGETIPVENKELFVLHKDNGQWKIFHYMFNKTK